MCTAVTWKNKDFYFGRTLDSEQDYGGEVTVMPRRFPLTFRNGILLQEHHALIGMACTVQGHPLYFDAVNDHGLAMAGLNFVGYAHYRKPMPGKDNIAHFELIPWILGQCATVQEARIFLERINITEEAFSPEVPKASLHWILADRTEAVTLEAVREGFRLFHNPVGVLTNNPPFDQQLLHLSNYMHLSPEPPENRFSAKLSLKAYSRGMGAMGLPGDWSSQSRFVRAAFAKLNAQSEESEGKCVSQFFHILGSVNQSRGCCHLGNGDYEITQYTSCCNADRGIYYYTTYDNQQITGVDMNHCNPEGSTLTRYSLITDQQIQLQN